MSKIARLLVYDDTRAQICARLWDVRIPADWDAAAVVRFTHSGIVALRRRVPHTCSICGQGFTAYTTAVYCSNKCRQAAKYRRGKAAKGEKK